MAIRLIFIFIITFSCVSPLHAEEDPADNRSLEKNKVFHLRGNIDLVSTLKFEYARPSITIKIVYPQLRNNKENEETDEYVTSFNESVLEIIRDEMANFKNEVAQARDLQSDIPRKKLRNDFFIDYDASVVMVNKQHIISIRFSFQGIIDGVKHASHYHRVLNYILETSERLELNELFNPTANYILYLSNYVQDTLMRDLENNIIVNSGAGQDEANFKNWNIKANGLLFTFEERQVAPYSYGSQTILVPYRAIKNIISPSSPLWVCVHGKNKCLANSLITGGFIDEAINTKHRRLNPILSKL